jgi:hypothetical protein
LGFAASNQQQQANGCQPSPTSGHSQWRSQTMGSHKTLQNLIDNSR